MTRSNESRPTPETVADECLAARARIIGRGVTGIYDEHLRPLGLRVSQMGILVAIDQMGQPKPTDVGRQLLLDKSTLSRNVELMARHGWIATVAGEDARSHQLRLEPKGRRLLERALPAWLQAQQKMESILGAKDAAAMRRIALKLMGGN